MTSELKKYISSFINLTESKEKFNYDFSIDSEFENKYGKYVFIINRSYVI